MVSFVIVMRMKSWFNWIVRGRISFIIFISSLKKSTAGRTKAFPVKHHSEWSWTVRVSIDFPHS